MASTYIPKFRTLQGFMNWKPEDRYKYEWNKGKIEKTYNMKQLEAFILKALNRLFATTLAYKRGGELLTELDVLTSPDQLRRPDLSFYSQKQIDAMGKGANEVPPFLIEIISPNDNQTKVLEKNQEYFLAGVKVIWLIMPNIKQVHIYHSPRQVQICMEDDICSAKPVLADFEISVNDLLKLPV